MEFRFFLDKICSEKKILKSFQFGLFNVYLLFIFYIIRNTLNKMYVTSQNISKTFILRVSALNKPH